jgi:hypothetical protein
MLGHYGKIANKGNQNISFVDGLALFYTKQEKTDRIGSISVLLITTAFLQFP